MARNNSAFIRSYHQRKHRSKWPKRLLLVVVVAIVGGGLYWAIRWFTTGITQLSPGSTATLAQTVPMLKIPEWGVALRLDVYTSDTTHELLQANPPFVALSNSRLTDIARNYPNCNNVNTNVRLMRAKPGDTIYGQVMTEAHLKSSALQIGQYYYYIYKGASCHQMVNGTDLYGEVNTIQTRLSKLYITAIPTD